MIIHEDSNKTLIVAHHQILDYSVILHQIIHSFDMNTS